VTATPRVASENTTEVTGAPGRAAARHTAQFPPPQPKVTAHMTRLKLCQTKYLGPTDTRGARVVAKHLTTGKRVTAGWDYALDVEANH
jgi:hypothetical protein